MNNETFDEVFDREFGDLTVRPIVMVGSRYTCNPAPNNTDRDWLVLISKGQDCNFMEKAISLGFEIGGSRINDEDNIVPECDRFISLTNGVDNLITTLSDSFYKKFLAATEVSKRLNILDKSDRVALFQAVLYANFQER